MGKRARSTIVFIDGKKSTEHHRNHPDIEFIRWEKEHEAPSYSFDGKKSTKHHRIHSIGKRARSTIEFIQQ
jgi:hypothetical protein